MTTETLPTARADARYSAVFSMSALALLLPFVATIAVAAASGGFNPTSFGWTALAFAWVVIVILALSAPGWGTFDVLWLGAAASLCIFTFASAFWAGSAADAVDGGQRLLEYFIALVAALLVLRIGRLTLWLCGLGLGAACVSVYSLATRLFPDHFGAFNADAGYRLFAPIGYWNALGLFAAIGSLLSFGVATGGRRPVLSVLSALALVPLAATQYFTFSRGAWLALAFGLIAMFALSGRRVKLLVGFLVLAPMPAISVLLASRASALTHRSVTVGAAAHSGHRFAVELVLLAAIQAALGAICAVWLVRIKLTAGVHRTIGFVAAIAVVLALIAVFATYRTPTSIARHAYDSFVSSPTGGTDLNSRLFSLSNNGRTVLWRSALDDFESHPVAGSGGGSFGRWWLEHRETPYFVEDAHNLYVQTLAEGGIIGIALLAAFLALPLIAGVRARRHPLVAPAFGAYAAFLVHSAVDWDWQVPAVTLLAFFAAAVLVAAARDPEAALSPAGAPVRAALAGVAVVAAMVAFVGLIGNIALANATAGILNRSGRSAVADARKAHRWAPWSAVAVRALGESQLLTGQRAAGLAALRQASAKDPGDWQTWFDIAAVTTGVERKAALARARALNPHAPELTSAALRIR